MAEVATNLTDFSSTGRTGRRNALPDILDVGTTVTGDELVVRLDSLAIGEGSYICMPGGYHAKQKSQVSVRVTSDNNNNTEDL